MHDLLYNLGFNEMAGNFQEINRGKGGVDGDAVIVNSQDGQGYNNAFFLTPSVRSPRTRDAWLLKSLLGWESTTNDHAIMGQSKVSTATERF